MAPSFTVWFAPGVRTSGGVATTLIETLALVNAPPESVTLKVIVYGPAAAYAWLPVQVPAPLVSLTVPAELAPSPHVIVHVWVSAVPASLKDAFAFTDDDSFQERGIVDSTGVLELVCHLQERYAITIDDDELIPDNLDSLSKVARFVERKRRGLPKAGIHAG